MTTVHVEVAPEVLRWAISRAGWDESKANQHVAELKSWLEGRERPTLKQLEKFAHDTHAPFGQLFLSKPPEEVLPIADMRTFRNKAVAQPSGDLLDTIYLCQERQDWYREFARSSGMDPVEIVGSATLKNSPEDVSARIRELLSFEPRARAEFKTWQDAFRQLIDRVEHLGVLVMVSGIVGGNTHRKLNAEEFRGFALTDAMAPLVFVNGSDTKAGQIFTLVHELAHIFLGESALSDTPTGSRGSSSHELWCNRVAAEVLVPVTQLKQDYGGELSVEELERLARKYRVSTLVILRSVLDAKLVPRDVFETRYHDELSRVLLAKADSETKSGGNFYHTQALRLGHRFAEAVLSSTFAGSTGYRDAYHLLGTKKHATLIEFAKRLGVS